MAAGNRKLRQRILTALALIPCVTAVTLLAPTWLFALLVGIVFLATQWEWTRLCGLERTLARVFVLLLAAIAMAVLWWLRHVPWLWAAVLAAGVAWWLASLLWLRMFTFAASPARENIWLKQVVSLPIIVPAWVALTAMHGLSIDGRWWTLLALCVVWSADIGAFFGGRAFGKRKLAPRISPGKTRAGAWAAVLAGLVVSAAGGCLLHVHDARLLGVAVLGIVTVAAAIIGDLFESLMKRHADAKDSSTILPGHGGLLDRLDSLFAAMPVFAAGLMVLGS